MLAWVVWFFIFSMFFGFCGLIYLLYFLIVTPLLKRRVKFPPAGFLFLCLKKS